MCGIAGKMYFDRSRPVDPGLLSSMTDSICYRGPDDEGNRVWGNVGLAYRRLSIIGLDNGRQPISNEDETVWVVFNGEIYNYQSLQRILTAKGHRFRTETDTEVLVHLYEEFGEGMFGHLEGMFAFAIFDRPRDLLILGRDRTGIKPIYYTESGESLVFASEIKAILQDTSIRPEVDPRVIDRFLTFMYLPGEEVLRGIKKLPPGSYLVAQHGKTRVEQYWDLAFEERAIGYQEAQEELRTLLDRVVHDHLISDVRIGFLLSGGVDSTTLLGLSSQTSTEPFATFTIGFDGMGIADERPLARQAARRFGTDHYETTISSGSFLEFMPRYVWHMEEPVCEPPAIALYYVSKLASEHVKVVISGEGGDEAFAGYSTYRNWAWFERLRQTIGPGASPLARLLGPLTQRGPLSRFQKYAMALPLRIEDYYYSRSSGPHTLFNRLASTLYTDEFARLVEPQWALGPLRALFGRVSDATAINKMLYVDTKTWLPDDLLLKADKMTMANSLELRVPFLDHRILEFAASLPTEFKLGRFSGKRIVRDTFASLFPPNSRSGKRGFLVPYERWFSQELGGAAREVLLDPISLGRGYFRRSALEDLLNRNSSQGVFSKEVFSLMVLELWHRQFVDDVKAVDLQGLGRSSQ